MTLLTSDILLLPGDDGFEETLTLAWEVMYSKNHAVAVYGSDGLIRSIQDERELREYLEGGEYDERESMLDDPFELEIAL